jgi:uncharacterized protein
MQETAQYASLLAKEFNLDYQHIRNVLSLLEGGATVPFIARYRKEMTGSMNEEIIIALQKRYQQLIILDKRKAAVLESIQEQDKLTEDLRNRIQKAMTLQEVEDIYLPYKPKRRTRALIAREKGLEPLAALILSQDVIDIRNVALKYISKEKEVVDVEDALTGARDIIAEWISEDVQARSSLRRLYHRSAGVRSKVVKGKEGDASVFRQYFDWQEPLSQAPSHRLLAMFRGENEEKLRIQISVDDDKALELIHRKFVRSRTQAGEQVQMAASDAWKRLLSPSLENEIRAEYKAKADEFAVKIFAENLRQLLMSPPAGQKRTLAIDPGFRTGCKVVVLDRYGTLMHNETIFPHPPEHKVKEAVQKLKNWVESYKIELIAIGNGTAGRETEDLVRTISFGREVTTIMVNESGASIYSASKVARDEFPDHDITVRGAVSIGRRLMDPLAELVKIDPKSIGVGQYQHDVDQKMLQESLVTTVESCVNAVGVELNTASEQLLSYVSGLGPQLASNIIKHRDEIKGFSSRNELLKVPRLGAKAFEQCAGFLRIREGENPLDASAVHPESYPIVHEMAKKNGLAPEQLIGHKDLWNLIRPDDYITETAGLETINDIIAELEKPGRDPRKQFENVAFAKDIRTINDLKNGMVLNGIVTNITAFGAFVDIGVHQDGLVHVSQMADRFVRDPNQLVRLNQTVRVIVLEVDIERNRINLSMKLPKET